MDIVISNASNQPIYEQIYTQIKNCIICGELTREMFCRPYGRWQRTCGSA